MIHYLIELALWLLLAYFIGCLIGYLLRRRFGTETIVQPVRETIAAQPESIAVAALAAVPEVAAPEPVTPARVERPRGLSGPRDGKADDLQKIRGIGPKNEKILHSLGFFHFDQIAAWNEGEVAWIDDHLRFNGRIGRERWIEQATLLAERRLEEFRTLFGTGGQKNSEGAAESGSRTRRS